MDHREQQILFAEADARLVSALSLAPLLWVADGLWDSLAMGGLLTLTLGCGMGLAYMLRRRVPPALRVGLFFVVAAGVVGLLSLGLAFGAWDFYRQAQPVLPFLLFSVFAFDCMEEAGSGESLPWAASRVGYWAANIFALCLLYGVLREAWAYWGMAMEPAVVLLLLAFCVVLLRLLIR